MNKTSTDKITSATPFLIWFRRCVPANLQTPIRSYLDQPYQLALTILDCCNSTRPLMVREIAESAGVTYSTAQQVLRALKEGGMTFVASPSRSWQPVEITPLVPNVRAAEFDAPLTAVEMPLSLTAPDHVSDASTRNL
ncbi:MAG: helix-turn-helix domain-containing protein [Leptolyngbyaceae cyanobacterium bins.349]|nr:helix-turn-helix domain-containing protein [Leptolyngbyaceae cyanobacterium bins.349]